MFVKHFQGTGSDAHGADPGETMAMYMQSTVKASGMCHAYMCAWGGAGEHHHQRQEE